MYNGGMDIHDASMPQTMDSTAATELDTRRRLIGDIEEFLFDAIQRLEPETAELQRHAGRPRILPALCLWAGLPLCVLAGFRSQLAL